MPPRRLSFQLLATGGAPLVYLPGRVVEKPQASRALGALLTRHPFEGGLATPAAWEDLLAAVGIDGQVFVVDRGGDRWEVRGVQFDPGGFSGQLRVRHQGRKARRGDMLIDLQDAYGYMIPIVVYKDFRYERNPGMEDVFDMFDQPTGPPPPPDPAHAAHARLMALKRGDVVRLGRKSFEVTKNDYSIVAKKVGTKGRKYYILQVEDAAGNVSARQGLRGGSDVDMTKPPEAAGPLIRENPPRRFDVRSPAQGLRAIKHPVITRNFEKALRVKPKRRKAVLVPCAGTKPFPDAPSHKHGYLKGLEGKKLDIYVVSEPLGIVPYEWSRKYPQESYDFPPAHLRGEGRALLVDRIADWFERGPRYEKVYLALPAHHRRLVLDALGQFDSPPVKIKDVGLGACLESGTCPPGHFRPTSEAYRGFLRTAANPPAGLRFEVRDFRMGGEGSQTIYAAFGAGEDAPDAGQIDIYYTLMGNLEDNRLVSLSKKHWPAKKKPKGVARVTWIEVPAAEQRQGIATALYAKAARVARKDGFQLLSDSDLAPGARGFWEKQVRRGRARPLMYALSYPPPRSLANPLSTSYCERCHDITAPGTLSRLCSKCEREEMQAQDLEPGVAANPFGPTP
jgi:GNAT superfamily N-acetyltransferase